MDRVNILFLNNQSVVFVVFFRAFLFYLRPKIMRNSFVCQFSIILIYDTVEKSINMLLRSVSWLTHNFAVRYASSLPFAIVNSSNDAFIGTLLIPWVSGIIVKPFINVVSSTWWLYTRDVSHRISYVRNIFLFWISLIPVSVNTS